MAASKSVTVYVTKTVIFTEREKIGFTSLFSSLGGLTSKN